MKWADASTLNETTNATNIFDDKNIEKYNSNFNQHRKAVIRNVVETNLKTAITSFDSNANANNDFVMPKISETDWDIIENNVCAISFLQGMSIGSKIYNGYAVSANTLTREYIDENDIYILMNDNTYCKANGIDNLEEIKEKTGYYPGIWKLNFKQKRNNDIEENQKYYVPMGNNCLERYYSMMGNYKENSIIHNDMYTYINKSNNEKLKKAYYVALGRERWGHYNVNNINYEIYGNNGNEYFLKDY